MGKSYNGKTPYSLHLNIKDMDLVANCPDPVRILKLETMGGLAWLLKLLVLGKLVILFITSSSTCLNVKLPSAIVFKQ